MVAQGDLHLAGVYTLAPHLTEENHRAVLQRARGLSKRQIERLVVELSPRPEQTSLIRACPPARRPPSPVLPPPGAPRATIAPKPRAVVPVAPRRYQIRITVDEKTHGQLEKLQNLLAHQIPDRDPAAVIARALELLLRETLAKKAAITDKPRKRRAGSRRSRHIPAAIRRQVWQRDQAQCTFRDDQGRRCTAEKLLEYHHIEPWGKGGAHSVAQITLRCRAHNQHQAVLDYGAAFMTGKRNTEKSSKSCGHAS
jgi:5-methylcytosine-specific restriction endonuclease McrA